MAWCSHGARELKQWRTGHEAVFDEHDVVIALMISHSGQEDHEAVFDEHDLAPMSSHSLHRTLLLNHRWKRGLYMAQLC